MARYRSSIDLGAFIGMRHLSLPIGDDGKPINGIFIPTGINGIDVREDNRGEGKGNQSGFRAFVNFQQRTLSNAYITSIKNRLVSKGEAVTPYNVPAWQMCYILPEERRNAIRAALKKKLLAQHPEWTAQEDVQGTDLSRAISTMMPFQMGDSYLIEEQNAQQPSYNNAPVAQQVYGYTPVAAPPADQQWQAPADDDLPF